MNTPGGAKLWFTAQELADLGLSGLSKTKRKINELAAERRWAFQVDVAGTPLARARAGRGGGLEYHFSVLPQAAIADLVKRGLVQGAAPAEAAEPARDQRWAWFEKQSASVKAKAESRLQALDVMRALEAGGLTRTASAASVAAQVGVSIGSVWNWDALVAGVDRSDWLPALAPRLTGGGAEAEIHADAWKAFKTDYLRPERPTLRACYERLVVMAAGQGWGEIPHWKTLQRKLEREVAPQVILLARDGADALRRSLPPQTRTVEQLHALQHVNIDGHRWDVFCRWPDGRIARPMMVAIQDLYSRKMLAWRIGPSESADEVRLCFADLFRTWGVPEACTLDNGRGFASKWITGGAPNRFRFKVQPSDPTGLLTQLGVKIHWTLPYRGQSKPIERAFRDLCDHGAKHPAFAGAYTGNKPDAKPENYGSKAVEIETFKAVVGAVIAAHNAREGRRTEMAKGVASFDQVFEASYAAAPIRRATPEQLRMALLAADKVSTDRKSGAVRLFENTYWTPEMGEHAGTSVIVRFDPEALHSEVHVYDLGGRYLATAPVWEAVGFTDTSAARDRARLEANHRRSAREALKAEQLLTMAELADLLPADAPEPETASPNVIRPIRLGGAAAAALKPAPAPQASTFMDQFMAGERRLRVVE